LVGEEESRRRLSVNSKSTSAQVDLVERPEGQFWSEFGGTVHHIAFRCREREGTITLAKELVDIGCTSPGIDRFYFHSIYFREPGGILFEIATEGPGFTVDEPVKQLGESLKLHPSTSNIGPKSRMHFRRF